MTDSPETDDTAPASTEPSNRPTYSVTAAAKATGKSRRTIGRMLDAGELPGAHRDDSGTWSIPTEALGAAGLRLHAPSPPDPPNDRADDMPADQPDGPNDRATVLEMRGTRADGSSDRTADLVAELAEWRRRAEVAEAIATEREKALADLRRTLDMATRMLPATTPAPDFPDAPSGDFPYAVDPRRDATTGEAPRVTSAPAPGRLARLWRNRR